MHELKNRWKKQAYKFKEIKENRVPLIVAKVFLLLEGIVGKIVWMLLELIRGILLSPKPFSSMERSKHSSYHLCK